MLFTEQGRSPRDHQAQQQGQTTRQQITSYLP